MLKEQALVAVLVTQILCNEESVSSGACNLWFMWPHHLKQSTINDTVYVFR